MSALYELSGKYLELQKLTDADDSDMARAIADTMEGIGGEIQAKAEAIVTVALNMGADVDAIDAEIARLQERKKAIVNRKNSIKDYLRTNMEATGITKISCPLFTVSCVQGREIAVIDNADEIPDEYVTVKTDIYPDKNAITKALKEGIEIPGARLDRAKSSIRIK